LALGSLKFYKGINVPNVKNVCYCVIAGDGGNFVLALCYVAPSINFVLALCYVAPCITIFLCKWWND
jgi:hypothetical protein